MKIEIIKPNHFCLFNKAEVGIAVNKYSANRFRDDESKLYLSDSKSQEFGWIDRFGNYYLDSKYSFTRPSKERIIEELKNFPELLNIAQEKNLIKLI